ncbi:redoxin family protein [Achromobacter sp. ACM03]|uniref:Redoxin family protein n=1 Tax=Achromobacter aegrifaciens TaxID=1287736 RepID=A0ABU2DJW3_ACHAE|nr:MULTISPECIES: prolipoprotein diacylglyceryl transferase family protein [Achromobacter]MBD9428851.1 redoxin family protein [Achromobacter sp. ACM03]MDR7948421.1 redoxin family protein [Achromobacter aegrifaciens]CAB3637251.1 Thiol-disulfide oxidoreductase ResA [Achromobacter aegrifaciens]
MTPAIRIGPLVFPSDLLVLIVAAAIGLLAARLLTRGQESRPDTSTVLWRALIIGLVVARLGFVWQFQAHFIENPLRILDVRDGGWAGMAGLAAAWLYTLYAALRRQASRPALLGALALASAVWIGGGRWLARAPQALPELSALALRQLDGTPAALAAYQGKPTVINLWASWCPPCRREMPAFTEAQAAHPDVNFVFLNQAEAPPDVTAFLAQHAPSLRNVLLDPAGAASRQMSNRGLPATLFLDAQGRLVDLRVGELSAASLAQRLEAIQAPASGD